MIIMYLSSTMDGFPTMTMPIKAHQTHPRTLKYFSGSHQKIMLQNLLKSTFDWQ